MNFRDNFFGAMRRCLLFFFCGILTGAGRAAEKNDFDTAWRGVEKAIQAKLSPYAASEIMRMESKAVSRHDWAQAIRCVASRIRVSHDLDGVKMEELLPVFSRFTQEAPAPMQPGLHLLLAHLYWKYYRQNRWRYGQRVETGKDKDSDTLSFWSLPRILDEIEKHFDAAMAYENQLRLVPVETYAPLLKKGTAEDTYRPTLFDFVLYDMIDFYGLSEQIIRVEDSDPLDATGPCLGPVDRFLQDEIDTKGKTSPTLRAVALFQKLLKFHEGDKDRTAYADADLNRLQFCYNHCEGETKDARYIDALDQFMARHRKMEVSARAAALRARMAKERDPGLARLIAARGAAGFPRSAGAAECRNLIAEIESPSLSFTVERMWCDPYPEIRVHYRNLTDVSFRLFPLSFGEWLKTIGRANLFPLLPDSEPVKSWTQALPPASDYKMRTFAFPSPRDLPPGLYLLLASADPSFGKAGVPVMSERIRVSDLALITESAVNGRMKGFVLRAKEGTPVAGAQVQVWRRKSQKGFVLEETVRTEKDGSFSCPAEPGKVMFYATDGKDAAHAWSGIDQNREENTPAENVISRALLFTDRGLYRPGQTVHFKSVLFRVDRKEKTSSVLPRQEATVILRDTERKIIGQLKLRSNDYGSCSGSFVLPVEGKTGEMSIAVPGYEGARRFRVEEYKRPSFRVKLDPPSADIPLNTPALLTGRAVTGGDLPVPDAKVSWSVQRTARFPEWTERTAFVPSREIARGTVTTDEKGAFSILFSAQSDASVNEQEEASFLFTVHVDVTDAGGETRAASTSLEIGSCSWRASFETDDWLPSDTPVAFTLSVRSLSGAPVVTRGQLRIFSVKQPNRVHRSPWLMEEEEETDPLAEEAALQTDIRHWEDNAEETAATITTDKTGAAKGKVQLKPGVYRFRFETVDNAGKRVSAVKTVRVFDPHATKFPLSEPDYFLCSSHTAKPGDTLLFLWGTGYSSGTMRIRVMQDGHTLLEKRNAPTRTQEIFSLPITEKNYGEILVQTLFLRENRLYTHTESITVPRRNQKLSLHWEHFTQKLKPGKKETWTLRVTGPDNHPVSAEVIAALYDKSLDTSSSPLLLPLQEKIDSYCFRPQRITGFFLENERILLPVRKGEFLVRKEEVDWGYRTWEPSVITSWESAGKVKFPRLSSLSFRAPGRIPSRTLFRSRFDAIRESQFLPDDPSTGPENGIPFRKNPQETAFFFPCLTNASNGCVSFSFPVPEALSGWHFLAFAHDRQLRNGILEENAIVTRKDLMVEPLPPQFAREGDDFLFPVKITNTSGISQHGLASLTFLDTATRKNADVSAANQNEKQTLELSAGESKTLFWRIHIPDGQGNLRYCALAATDNFSDGEEGELPVRSRLVAAQESLSIPLRGRQIRRAECNALVVSQESATLRHRDLTVQVVSGPSWYAVTALPFLMELPQECNEQIFHRLYANTLAQHILTNTPGIRTVFGQRIKTDVDLLKRFGDERESGLKKLRAAQADSGEWPWFPGGEENLTVTLRIVAGFGRLRRMTGTDTSLATDTLSLIDNRMAGAYTGEKRTRPFSRSDEALYLYARTFFLNEKKLSGKHAAAFDSLVRRAKEHWEDLDRASKVRIALALHRLGDKETSTNILKSLAKRVVRREGEGMFWHEESDLVPPSPIETQALFIEAFREIADDDKSVEECRTWLLRQRQAQGWSTTTATADAIYALLDDGKVPAGAEAAVDISLGGTSVPKKTETANTGFYEHQFGPKEIQSNMGNISLIKKDDGVSWFSLYWRYLEEKHKIPEDGVSPLRIRKAYAVRTDTKEGKRLRPVSGPLERGAELVILVEIDSDRSLEFVHLKDEYPACAEPFRTSSGYRRKNGLEYYESNRDSGVHFYFDRIPKGHSLLEYSLRLHGRGTFHSGNTRIECMYAPEFSAQTSSSRLTVK